MDGNKRLALTAMVAFLRMNDFVLHASGDELLDFSLRVANNEMSRGDSADFVVQRASRLTWSAERFVRWVRSLSGDALDGVSSALTRDDAGRFDEAIRARVRSLSEEAAPYLAS